MTVDTAATLLAALKTASAGDTIQLAPGDYNVSISGLQLGGVTITSADFIRPATITQLNLTNSSGVTFSDLEFRTDRSAGDMPFRITSSSDVTFERLNVHGSLDGDPQNDVSAFLVRGGGDIVFKDSEFQQAARAVGHLDVDGLTVVGNYFHDLRSDGVSGGGSDHVSILDNRFTNFKPVKGDHPDAIQFWTTNTTENARDIHIAGNVITRGSGDAIQGVFMGAEVAGRGYERVVIENNVMSGTMYHGITVGAGADVTIRDNIVQGFTDMKSRISVGSTDGVVLSNNSTNALLLDATDTNVVQDGNKIVALASDGGAWALAAWRALGGGDRVLGLRGEPMSGGVADDRLFGSAGATTISGGAGNDTIVEVSGSNVLRGDDGDDVIRGGFDFDDINGNAGNDTAFGGSGNDWVVGGKGNDSLSGDAGDDLVYGNLGNDTLSGGDGNDTLRGGQDDDSVSGGAGADFISGDLGNDTLDGGAGADTFYSFAGTGLDLIVNFNAAEGDRVQLAAGSTWSVDQIGADVVISIGGGGQVVLGGVTAASLPSGWIFS